MKDDEMWGEIDEGENEICDGKKWRDEVWEWKRDSAIYVLCFDLVRVVSSFEWIMGLTG